MSDLVEAPPVEALPEGTRSIGPYTIVGAIGPGRRTFAHLAKDQGGTLFVLRELKSSTSVEAFEAELKQSRGLAVGEAALPLLHAGSQTYAPHRAAVGESLGTILSGVLKESRPVEIGVALSIAMGVADRLAQEPRPHGDLVPHHVIVGYDGVIHLRDPAADSYRERCQAASRRPYRSPEHVRADPLVAGSDVFVLGILLFELSTGRRLFDGPDERRELAILEAESPKPRELVGDAYPIELQLVLRKLLRPTPAGRFIDGRASKEALRLVAATRADAGPSALAHWMRARFPERLQRWTTFTGPLARPVSDLAAETTHPLPQERPLSRAKTQLSPRTLGPLSPESPALDTVRQRLEALGSPPVEASLKAEIEALKSKRRVDPSAHPATLTEEERPLLPSEVPELDPEPTEIADSPPGGTPGPERAAGVTSEESADQFHFEALFDPTVPKVRAKKPQSKPMPPLDVPLPELPSELGGPRSGPRTPLTKEPPPILSGEERPGSQVRTQLDEVVESTLTSGSFPPGFSRESLIDLSGLPPLSEAVEQAGERTPLDLELEVTRQDGGARGQLPPRDSTLVDPLPVRRPRPSAEAQLSEDLVLNEAPPSDRTDLVKDLAHQQAHRAAASGRIPDTDDTIDDDSVLQHLSRDELAMMAQATDLPIPPSPPKAPPAPAKPAAPRPPPEATLRPEPAPLFKEAPPLDAGPRGPEQARLATQVVRDRIVPNRAAAEPKAAPIERNIATQVVRDRIVPNHEGAVPDVEEWAKSAAPTAVLKDRQAAARAPTAPLPRPSESSDGEEGVAIIPISDDELAAASKKRLIGAAIGLGSLVMLAGVGLFLYRNAETEVEALVIPDRPAALERKASPTPAPPKVVIPTSTVGATPSPPSGPTPIPVEAEAPLDRSPPAPSAADLLPAPTLADDPAEAADVVVEPDPPPAEDQQAPRPPPARSRPRPPPREKRPTVEKAPPPVETPPPTEPAPAPITIRVLPETATVLVDGKVVKNGSLLEVDDQPVQIEASAPGYESARATVQPGWSKPVLLMLRKSKQP